MALLFPFIIALLALVQLSSVKVAFAAGTDQEINELDLPTAATAPTDTTPASNIERANIIFYTDGNTPTWIVLPDDEATPGSIPPTCTTLPATLNKRDLDPQPDNPSDPNDFEEPWQPFAKDAPPWYEATWVKAATWIFVTFDCLSVIVLTLLLSTGYLDWGLNFHPSGQRNTQNPQAAANNRDGRNRTARRRNNRSNRNEHGGATGNAATAGNPNSRLRPRFDPRGRPTAVHGAYDNAGLRQRQGELLAAAADRPSRPPVALHPQLLHSTETLMGGNSDEDYEEMADARTERQRRLDREQAVLDAALRRAGLI
ncbi:hypothetical protein MBLNU230_g0962t1 [Neophaeotheca triangularis]